jgi:hypothetical protein
MRRFLIFLVLSALCFSCSLGPLSQAPAAATGAARSVVALKPDGTWNIWDNTKKMNLTFAVSNDFGGNESIIVTFLFLACGLWESYAEIQFKYAPSEDGDAVDGNGNVAFVVRPATSAEEAAVTDSRFADSSYPSGWPCLIRIYSRFFINNGRFLNKLTHEVGHMLGLAHEDATEGVQHLTRATTTHACLSRPLTSPASWTYRASRCCTGKVPCVSTCS